ncbi:hypothetical protein H6F61_24465 [Cyanobacteria bacterium FACHB-472]|nr:hypothetical protein [Cyanobacteria bacterium FACHB-472]
MNKTALAMLASPVILASMLLLANAAQAAEASNAMLSAPTAQVVVADQQVPASVQPSNPIKDQMGCSCAACTKALSQMQGQFVL